MKRSTTVILEKVISRIKKSAASKIRKDSTNRLSARNASSNRLSVLGNLYNPPEMRKIIVNPTRTNDNRTYRLREGRDVTIGMYEVKVSLNRIEYANQAPMTIAVLSATKAAD